MRYAIIRGGKLLNIIIMRKILFLSAAVMLLAAGCKGNSSTSINYGTPSENGQQNQNAQTQAKTQAQSNVTVNNSDDAVNLIESASANEQAKIQAGDDSDLSSSDSTDLNSFTEVSNGY